VGCLLVGALLGGSPTAALAATPEMRGEWELLFVSARAIVRGEAIISVEADAEGNFASSSGLLEGVVKVTFAGKLEGSKASVTATSEKAGAFPGGVFSSNSMTVNTSGSLPTISGTGTATVGSQSEPEELTATRIHTYKEIEEREERERREREEAEARENVRGEWAVTVTTSFSTVHGVARITQAANAKNEFASSSALVEGADPGSFSGTLEGAKATVTLTAEAIGTLPSSTFASNSIVVESTASSMSMSGSGKLQSGGAEVPATMTATRTKNYQELRALETQERLEREARETKERLEREAREKLEREAREAREREAREKLEKEEALKLAAAQLPATQTGNATGTVTISAQPTSRSLTASASGSLSLGLANPNAFAVQGRLTLLLASSPTSRSAAARRHKPPKKAQAVLGKASFTIAANGHLVVKITLSKAGRAALARHRTLAAIARIVTQASGKQSASKSYRLTLHAPTGTHVRH
jgi:hypothetical protein